MPDSTPSSASSELGASWLDPQTRMFEHRARVRPAFYYEPVISFMSPKIRRLLDVGCGAGTVTLPLAERSEFGVGVDMSHAALQLAQQRHREQAGTNLAWVVADAAALPFAPESFDALVSINVVRLTDIPKTLQEMRRVLTRGGRLAVKDHLRSPQPFGFWGMYIPRIIRYMPSWVLHYGPGNALEMVRYRFSPNGIAETRKSESLTADAFQKYCETVFVGSQIITTDAGVVKWEKK